MIRFGFGKVAWAGGWIAFAGLASAGVKSGHAEAELLAAEAGYSSGQPVQLGIRLKLDEGWHSYWVNPGESGMAMSVDWTLPEGWTAGPLLHPVPLRFMTGELPGYGYEGEVVIPVTLTPPADGKQAVTVTANVSWLTCSDSACVPGRATLSLDLKPGQQGPGAGATAIRAALEKIPRTLAGLKLEVTEGKGEVLLKVSLPPAIDASGCEFFPATPSALDPSKPLRLEKNGDHWRARVPLHEYAVAPLKALELVLAGGELAKPLRLSWKAEP